jgi:hypothetical protein
MPEDNGQYGNWSPEELRNAETTARKFLEDNSEQIGSTLRAKAKFLEALIERVSHRKTAFEDRLEYFARMSEIARMIGEEADGFFELASQPVVAQILGTVADEL